MLPRRPPSSPVGFGRAPWRRGPLGLWLTATRPLSAAEHAPGLSVPALPTAMFAAVRSQRTFSATRNAPFRRTVAFCAAKLLPLFQLSPISRRRIVLIPDGQRFSVKKSCSTGIARDFGRENGAQLGSRAILVVKMVLNRRLAEVLSREGSPSPCHIGSILRFVRCRSETLLPTGCENRAIVAHLFHFSPISEVSEVSEVNLRYLSPQTSDTSDTSDTSGLHGPPNHTARDGEREKRKILPRVAPGATLSTPGRHRLRMSTPAETKRRHFLGMSLLRRHVSKITIRQRC